MGALQPRLTQVIPLELVAVPLAVGQWARLLASSGSLLAFIDNQSALGIIQRGSASQPDLHGIVALLWARCTSLGCALHTVWVASAANLSDDPSRGRAAAIGSRMHLTADWSSICAAIRPGARPQKGGAHGPALHTPPHTGPSPAGCRAAPASRASWHL